MSDNLLKKIFLDKYIKMILWAGGITILFALASPIIFTLPSYFESINFMKTGQIGDTIGGIINPFIALAGVLLTFVAFYMQFKANQLQIDIHNNSIKEENRRIDLSKREDTYNKLLLLKSDLKVILNDIDAKSMEISTYCAKVISNPTPNHSLKRTPLKKYSMILEIDRLTIFKGFKDYLGSDWIKDYNKMYDLLELLPEYYKEMYDSYNQAKVNYFNQEKEIINMTEIFLDKLEDIFYKKSKTHSQYSMIKSTLDEYKKKAKSLESQESGDVQENNRIFLKDFFKQYIDNVDGVPTDTEGVKLIRLSSYANEIIVNISSLKNSVINLANTLEDQNNLVFENSSSKRTYHYKLQEIHEKLEEKTKKMI